MRNKTILVKEIDLILVNCLLKVKHFKILMKGLKNVNKTHIFYNLIILQQDHIKIKVFFQQFTKIDCSIMLILGKTQTKE